MWLCELAWWELHSQCKYVDLVPVTVKWRSAAPRPGGQRWWFAVLTPYNWAHKNSFWPPKDSCWAAFASKLLPGGLGFLCVLKVSYLTALTSPPSVAKIYTSKRSSAEISAQVHYPVQQSCWGLAGRCQLPCTYCLHVCPKPAQITKWHNVD